MSRNLLGAASRLRRTLSFAFVVGALVVPAAALADPPATPPRNDVYVEVWCRTPDGSIAAFERVDVQAVEQGNKDVQVANFGLHHEGWLCQIGPFV